MSLPVKSCKLPLRCMTEVVHWSFRIIFTSSKHNCCSSFIRRGPPVALATDVMELPALLLPLRALVALPAHTGTKQCCQRQGGH
jgi:hypothetical protein